MKNEITDIWQRIEAARKKSAKHECRFPMNPPATPAFLEQRLARVLDVLIPQQLYESLLVHNGMNHLRGGWFADCGMLIPCSAECIKMLWEKDRQRAAEAEAEGDKWANDKRRIPTVTDAIAENTIYIDADDGSVLCYAHASLSVHDFRYNNYLEFLQEIAGRIESDAYFEWPMRRLNKERIAG